MARAGAGPDIGVKIPTESIDELNGMVCTTTKRASEIFTGTTLSYGNIKRKNGRNSATSSGTSETEISGLRMARRMGRRETD